ARGANTSSYRLVRAHGQRDGRTDRIANRKPYRALSRPTRTLWLRGRSSQWKRRWLRSRPLATEPVLAEPRGLSVGPVRSRRLSRHRNRPKVARRRRTGGKEPRLLS